MLPLMTSAVTPGSIACLVNCRIMMRLHPLPQTETGGSTHSHIRSPLVEDGMCRILGHLAPQVNCMPQLFCSDPSTDSGFGKAQIEEEERFSASLGMTALRDLGTLT